MNIALLVTMKKMWNWLYFDVSEIESQYSLCHSVYIFHMCDSRLMSGVFLDLSALLIESGALLKPRAHQCH